MKRLLTKQIPQATELILGKQGKKCPICLHPIGRGTKQPVLDHDHTTGYIRGVLCRNCNGIEGKIHNLTRRVGKHTDKYTVLAKLLEYWEAHRHPQHGMVLHPTHRTDEEKRLELKKKAAARRIKAKEV
jgi:hypothetical protein